jgi:hypothetical protein
MPPNHGQQKKLIFNAKNIANYELYGTLVGETNSNYKISAGE